MSDYTIIRIDKIPDGSITLSSPIMFGEGTFILKDTLANALGLLPTPNPNVRPRLQDLGITILEADLGTFLNTVDVTIADGEIVFLRFGIIRSNGYIGRDTYAIPLSAGAYTPLGSTIPFEDLILINQETYDVTSDANTIVYIFANLATLNASDPATDFSDDTKEYIVVLNNVPYLFIGVNGFYGVDELTMVIGDLQLLTSVYTEQNLQSVLAQGNEATFQDDSLPAGSVSYESEDNNHQTIISQEPTNVSMYGKDITNDFQSNIAINSGSPEITKANITTAKATVVGVEDPTNDTNWKVPARAVDGDYVFAGKDEVKDFIYKSKVDSSAVTGTTSPVFPITITIPADKVSSSSTVKLKVRGRKTGTNGVFSLRCEGAIDAFFQTDNATRLGAEMEREFIIKGSVTEYPVYSQSLASPNGSINEFTQTAIDWTIDQDIDIGIELQNGSDSALISYIELYIE